MIAWCNWSVGRILAKIARFSRLNARIGVKIGRNCLIMIGNVLKYVDNMGGKYRKRKDEEMTLRRHSRPQQRAARRVAVAMAWVVLAIVIAALPLASWVRLWQAGDQVNWVPAMLGTAFMLLVSLLCMRSAYRRLHSHR